MADCRPPDSAWRATSPFLLGKEPVDNDRFSTTNGEEVYI
jgi:hypothetical protein